MKESRGRPSSSVLGYVVALALVATAVAVRWWIDPWLGDELALVTIFAAVAIAFWVAGVGPALLVVVTGYLACDYLFIGPPGGFGLGRPAELIGLVAYLVTCLTVVALGQVLRSSQRRAAEGREELRVTLGSIGDGVITTDTEGRVTNLNAVAESLTGWPRSDAAGRPLDEVFRIVDEETGSVVENPAHRALRDGRIVGLANHTVLVARDGSRRPIDDSAAPIRDEHGRVHGCVLVFRDVTARRAADRELRRKEEELSDFFENVTVALHWVRPDGTILRVNQAELDLLGYRREEYLGRHVAQFQVASAGVEDVLPRILRGEAVHERPARMRCKDGAIKDVLVTSSALFEDGALVNVRCITIDVTERKQYEEALASFAAIVSASDDAIVSKTLEGVIRSWNAGAERLFGYTAEEAIGRTIDLIIPPELLAEERSILARLRRGARIDHFETVRLAKDGRRVDISLTVSPIRDPTGRVIGASKVARDITERKRADEALRESEERFRSIADSAPVLIWLEDAAGRTFVNRAYLEFVGAEDPQELLGLGWTRHVHPDDLEGLQAVIAAAVERRAPFTAELRLRRRDGEYRWMQSVGVARFTPAGAFLGYTGCTYDVHDARSAEAALRDADRRKDEFIAMLAHELRNPLAPIRNSLELLRRADSDRALLESAHGTIERQLAHLVRLVDDLMDVSRITRDKLVLRRSLVELGPILEQVVESCRPAIEREGHTVETVLPQAPLVLDADPVRLTQVFSNLLDNACKYTAPGGRIRVAVRDEDDDEVAILVTDTGVGIPPEELEGIFEMFSQGEPAFERGGTGLGIGLTLVKRLVDLHGGRVVAHSEGLGRGSEFVVRLPLARGRAAEPGTLRVPDVEGPLRRILVVDDNRDNATSLAALLELAGHEVRVAHDGRSALDVADEFEPEVVLLDIGLPDLDGHEVCRRLRAHPWGRDVHLIALTGWGQSEDRQRSSEAGFDVHLVKPVDFEHLKRLLARTRASG